MDDNAQLWRISRGPVLVWVALVALLTATYAFAHLSLGRANLPLSLFIAAAKAALVAASFMRLATGNSLNLIAACVGPVWLFILFLLIGADYFTR
jgi:cytochrome c oxidase subunit 4